MARGKFIVFEGIDGSGKSTQSKLLYHHLGNRGYKVHFTKEGTDGPIGELIEREYLFGKRHCDETLINMLFAADRYEHITNPVNGILRYLNEGYHVICDRYLLSSLAYYTYNHIRRGEYDNNEGMFDKKLQEIYNINKINIDLLLPDLTIFIDIGAEESMKRINKRNKKIGIKNSIFEEYTSLQNIDISYLMAIDFMKKHHNMPTALVTETGNRDMVAAEVRDELYRFIDNI